MLRVISALFILQLLFPFYGHSQETGVRLHPVPYNLEKKKDMQERQQRIVKSAASSEMITIPFVDDFSKDHFWGNAQGNEVLWMNSQVFLNQDWALDPPTIGVASFDGTDSTGYPYTYSTTNFGEPCDTLLSAPIDLSPFTAENQIGLSFYYQAQGLGSVISPTVGDSLTLQFYAPDVDQWLWAWSVPGSDPGPFEFAYVPINMSFYLKEGFQFRFINYGRCSGIYDVWHIDYVWLDQNSTNAADGSGVAIVNDVAFVNPVQTLLQSYTSVPWTHYQENSQFLMRTDIDLLIRNLNNGPRTLEDNKIDVFYKGNLLESFSNPNEPGISAQGTLLYNQSVAGIPNEFHFDTGVNDTSAVFDVYFSHNVSDFSETESNDTIHFQQGFTDYYAYDDGTAEKVLEVSVSPGSGGKLALRYNILKSDTLRGLDIFYWPVNIDVEGTSFFISLWHDTGNGPGDLIEEQQFNIEFDEESDAGFQTFEFEEPIFLEAGNYFFGFRQTNQALYVGWDFNTQNNETNLYYQAGFLSWTQTGLSGSAMIRPKFTSLIQQPVGVNEMDLIAGLYPNPATDFIKIDLKEDLPVMVSIMDITGKLILHKSVNSGEFLDVSTLNSGFYIAEVAFNDGRRSTRKFIKN